MGKNKCYKSAFHPFHEKALHPASWQAGQSAKVARPHASGPFRATCQPWVLVSPPQQFSPEGKGLGPQELSAPCTAWGRAWPPVVKSSDSDRLGSASRDGVDESPSPAHPPPTTGRPPGGSPAPGSPQTTTDRPRLGWEPRADGETEGRGGEWEGAGSTPAPGTSPRCRDGSRGWPGAAGAFQPAPSSVPSSPAMPG